MKSIWLNKKSNSQLILFFNGWGMDKNPFSHLNISEYDLLMLYNYQDLAVENNVLDEIKNYKNITLISWSMGVWVSAYFAKNIENLTLSIAINGTLYPIHDDHGIPENVFKLTLENLSVENREKFFRRMFRKGEDYVRFIKSEPDRDINDQIQELKSLQSLIFSNNIDFKFDKVIVGKSDRIIPTQNQIKFWAQDNNPIIINEAHYPFFLWKSWEEVIGYAANN